MNKKRFLSFALSAAIALPLTAGLFLVEKTAQARVTEVDFIGSSAQAETFDNYSGDGWTSDAGTFSPAASGDTHFGLVSVAEVAKPAIGGAVLANYSNYPTYASGSALETQVRGKTTVTTTYTLTNPVSKGKLYFSTDMYGHFGVDYPGGISLIFYDSTGNTVAVVKTDNISSSNPDPHIRMYPASANDALDRTDSAVDWRGKTVTAFNIGLVFDIDNNTAVFSADYIGTDYIRKTSTQKNGAPQTMEISDISKIELRYTGTESGKNFAWAFDNMKLYNTYTASQASSIDVSYKHNDTTIAANSIDVSDKGLSAGDSCTYYVPAYIDKDSKLYKTTGDNYSRTSVLAEGTTAISETVTLAAEADYQYAEFDGAEPYGGAEYASNGEVMKIGTAATNLMTVREAGKYNITIAAGQSGGSAAATGALTAGSRTLGNVSFGSTVGTTVISGVNLAANDVIKLTSDSSYSAVDYILIEKTSNPAASVEINYMYNGSSVKTDTKDLTSSAYNGGDTYYYNVPAYFEGDDGNLYKTSNSSDEHGTLYQHSTTLVSGYNSVTENVSLAYVKGAYYFAEFDDTAPYAHSDYVSGGKVTAVGTTQKTLFTAEKNGLYSVVMAFSTANGGAATSTNTTVTMGGKKETISQTVNYPVVTEYNNVLLDINETINVMSLNNRAALDYILIVKTGDHAYPEAKHSETERRMEKLDRGTYAVYTGSGGVYLSWRLLGTESLANQAFDIYRDGTKIYTTGVHAATNYTDKSGTANSSYIVVPRGADISGETGIKPKGTYVNNYSSNSSSWMVRNTSAYFDIPITAPAPEAPAPASDGTSDSTAATYTANDASVGDLDGDGDYEIILKWDPSNSKDNSKSGLTSNVYISAYELDGTELWTINLGKNIRAGAHYTQFIVYDLDGDGRSEIAMKTAPGSTDGVGVYVTEAGDTETIRSADNVANYRNSSGRILNGPEYLTVFEGQTGRALFTTDFIARGDVSDWGDSYGNRVDRFLAGVAYLNGTTPSLIMTRGYYAKSVAAAYDWDGTTLSRIWLHESPSATEYSITDKTGNKTTYTSYDPATKVTQDITDADGKVVETVEVDISDFSIYGQGNHSLGVCDADGDGRDEIVFGSAVIDDDGSVKNTTGHGHGDAHHVSDFDNNGSQDIFSVHEWKSICQLGYGAELRSAADGRILANQETSSDNGRGIMGNFLDNKKYGYSQFWSSGVDGGFAWDGSEKKVVTEETPESNGNEFYSFGIYWDGDLARELQEKNLLSKFVENNGSPILKRYSWGNNVNHFADIEYNNGTKGNPCLSADLFGDWREEMIFRKSDGTGLRVFIPAETTDYRLYTLMHDSQYRTGVAMENVGYNQPPHASYYIGSAALAKDSETELNYLDPAVKYTNVTFNVSTDEPVEGSVTVFAGESVEKVTSVSGKTWDAKISNTISVPEGMSIGSDSITIKIGDKDAIKTDSLANKLKMMVGGNLSIIVAITDIPEDTIIDNVPITLSIGDVTDTEYITIE